MSYSDGSFFGYDELYINPTNNSYAEYNNIKLKSEKQPSAKYDNRVLKDIYNYENKPFHKKMKSYSNVYDYLEKNIKDDCEETSFDLKDFKIAELKKKLMEFKHKNDILLIFLIYLVIVIFVQYNMARPSHPPLPIFNSPYMQYMPVPSAPPAL